MNSMMKRIWRIRTCHLIEWLDWWFENCPIQQGYNQDKPRRKPHGKLGKREIVALLLCYPVGMVLIAFLHVWWSRL